MTNFKNCLIYQCNDVKLLQELAALAPSPDDSDGIRAFDNEREGIGYLKTSDEGDQVFFDYDGLFMRQFASRTVTAPAPLVRSALEQRRLSLLQRGVTLSNRELRAEREEVTADIKKRFPRVTIRSAWVVVEPAHGLIFIGTTTASFAEDLLGELRAVLGSLPVVPSANKFYENAFLANIMRAIMNDYDNPTPLAGDGNVVSGWIEAEDSEGNKVRRNIPEELQGSLSDEIVDLGYSPSKIAMAFHDGAGSLALTYRLDLAGLAVRRIDWVDDEGRENVQLETEGAEQLAFASTYAIVTLLSLSIRSLISAYSID